MVLKLFILQAVLLSSAHWYCMKSHLGQSSGHRIQLVRPTLTSRGDPQLTAFADVESDEDLPFRLRTTRWHKIITVPRDSHSSLTFQRFCLWARSGRLCYVRQSVCGVNIIAPAIKNMPKKAVQSQLCTTFLSDYQKFVWSWILSIGQP